MPTIRAVVTDVAAPAHLTLGEVESPLPAAGEALVRVRAISLNRGEVRAAQSAAAGARPGWDIAGVVERAAANGSGPQAGERVVGLLVTAAWAELVAVASTALAVLPDDVSSEQASTLPVAGLTALYALDRAAGLLERRVLVTGASGGVGIFGVQMASRAGAHVTGLVRQERHLQAVRDAGAELAVADETGEAARAGGPFNLALESVGGQVLANTMSMMAANGQVVCYGVSGGGPGTPDMSVFLRSRITVAGLYVFTEQHRETAAAGLARLARMVSTGVLRPLIPVVAPWTEIGPIAQQLLDRSYPGKAVLTVD